MSSQLFYQKCFFNDGSKLLFAGEFDGNRNYYLLDLQEQQATQLTEGAGDNTFGGFLSPDDRFLFYVKTNASCAASICRVWKNASSIPCRKHGSATARVANSDCTGLVGIEIDRRDWEPLSDWQVFKTFFEKKPHCRLLRVDLQTGEAQTILEQRLWLGHPIYRPFDDHTVAFCHEGPHDRVDARMWLIDEDGANMRKVKDHAEGESCTHEFWVPDGSALIYVSYHKARADREICRFDPVTGHNEVLMTMPACSHLMSNQNGTLLVGDGSGTPVDVQDTKGYTIDNDPMLWLFDVATRQHRPLAAHNSSGACWTATVRSRIRIRHLRRTTNRCCSPPTMKASQRSIW